MDLRLEVWDRLGTAGFGPKLPFLATINDSARLQPVNGIGEGRATLDDTFDHPEQILTTNPANPALNVRSLVRVYLDGDVSGVTAPYAEWLPEQLIPPSESESGRFELAGEGREAMVKDAMVLPWDWDGNQNWQASWPDWIYGGRDIVGPVETTFVPHIVDVWVEAGATGTFDLDIDIDGAGFQSATIAPGDNSFAVEAAIEGLPYGITAEVLGSGVDTDPWRIRLMGPDGTYTVAIDDGGLSGGGAFFNLLQYGRLLPVGWTISRVGATMIEHGPVYEFRASFGGGADPALPAGCSAWIMFDGGEYLTPGVQKIVRVVGGGIYQSGPVWLYAQGAGATVRLVLRDLNENLLDDTPGAESFEEITLVANTPTLTTGIGSVNVPDGVYEAVYRLGHIGTGDPPPIFMACPNLTEGFAASTVGQMVVDLHTDWTINHAASPYPISWWVHGDGGFYLALDFDGSVDAAGNAWTQAETLTIKRGERFDKVLTKIVALGYEWRIAPGAVDGYYLLQLFNAPTLGVDYSALATPTIRVSRDVIRKALRRWLSKTGAMVEGAEQWFSFARNTAAEGGWGVSMDYSVQLDYDGPTVNVAAQERVADQLRKTKSLVVNIADVNQPTFPIPGRTYVPGDTLRAIDPDDATPDVPERVWSINYARDENGLTWEVQLGNQSFAGGR